MASAPCPVLIIGSTEPVRRVLILLDASSLSEQALMPGLAVAAGLRCQVSVLRKDLIVISTDGHGGQRRWVYGAVAEKILRGAHCSILVVRPPADQLSG